MDMDVLPTCPPGSLFASEIMLLIKDTQTQNEPEV